MPIIRNFTASFEQTFVQIDGFIHIVKSLLNPTIMKASLPTRLKFLSNYLCLLLVAPIFPAAVQGMSPYGSIQQTTIHVTGIVTSEDDHQGLPGVNVLIKGTSQGTVTDADGDYTIDVPSNESVLVFSSIGYEPQEIPVNGRSTIDVTLAVSTTSLKELVVVGYGTQEKVSLTSSVDQISGEDLDRRPVNSLQQALQGKLPGVTILDKGGSPGSSNANIVVRGISQPFTPDGLGSLASSEIGDNGPLVLVDGVVQPYQNVNPADIASISILKDASSTAIYGSRASNGVILITTKRGGQGKVTVSYDYSHAVQKSIMHPEPIGMEDYFHLQNDAYANANPTAPVKYTDQYIQNYVKGSVEDPLHYPQPYNWYDVLLHTAPLDNHSLSISGGNDNFKGRMSLRYQDQDGVIANTNSKLMESRVNTDFTISPKLKLSADLYYQNKKDLEPSGAGKGVNEVFREMMQNAIWDVPKYPNGDYGGGTQGNNPLLLAEKGGTTESTFDYINGNIKGEWNILKGLTFTMQFDGHTNNGFVTMHNNTWETRDSTQVKKTFLHNQLNEQRSTDRFYVLNDLLSYSLDVGDHSMKFLAGYSQEKENGNSISAYRQDFYNNDILTLNQGANNETKDNAGTDFLWTLRSYFGRVNYSYKDKYLLEANARYDGSSKFSSTKQYAFFPSFSAGWRLSQEPFWGGLVNSVNEFKIRVSRGSTGNQAVPPFTFYPTLNHLTYDFGGNPVDAYAQQDLVNSNLTWETTVQTDAGLDAELLNGKFTFSADYYKKRTKGIILYLPVPATIGLNEPPQNAGIVDNTGWEFKLGSRNTIGPFALDANVNLSINKNNVVDLADTGPYYNGTADFDPRYITAEGHPINTIWGLKTDGLFQSDQEATNYPQFMRPAKAGDVKYLDLNGDGIVDPNDMTYLGNSFPKYIFGGGFNLTYKQFTLNLALQGAAGVNMVLARALSEMGIYEGFVPDIYANNYWTPEHTDARFPRVVKQDLRNRVMSDQRILNASYLRLKNIQLSYQLPNSLTKKLDLDQLSIYVSGTNLLTISKLNEWHLDPEATSGWQNYYPQVALYTVGAHVQF